MRSTCTVDDALDVIELMRASMVDYYENEPEMLNMTRFNTGTGSKRGKGAIAKQIVGILQKIADQKGNEIFNFDEIKGAIEVFIFVAFKAN
jgi:hypothetical protein